VEVRAERTRDLVLEEPADARTGDAPDDLTDEIPLRDRVVARRCSRFPPRLLRGEQRRRLVPVVEVRRLHRFLPAREAGAVTEDVGNLDAFLAVLLELRPIARDRRVEVQLRPVGENQRTQGGHRLRRRPHVDDRVALPGLGPRFVAVSSPDVDDGRAVDDHGHTGADICAAVEVRRERVAYALESRFDRALDLCHLLPLVRPTVA
jgi:hypothetical protein